MPRFLDVLRLEYTLSISRRALWIGFALVLGFYSVVIFQSGLDDFYEGASPWQEAGSLTLFFNIITPVVVGILSADRMERDRRLGVRELQRSTPFRPDAYVTAKYLGVLASALTPILLWLICFGVVSAASDAVGWSIVPSVLAAFLAITVPSYALVVAFSLVCPLVMPLRIYQVLFTGYWFWGNLLSSEVFPTISGTVLNASGVRAMEAFFGGRASVGDALYTKPQAWLNILVILLCASVALLAARPILARKERDA